MQANYLMDICGQAAEQGQGNIYIFHILQSEWKYAGPKILRELGILRQA